MNEKKQLLQSINAAMPIAQQMQALETEINALEQEVQKKSHYGCGTVFVMGLGILFGLIGLGTLFESGINMVSLVFIAFMAVCVFFLVNRIKRVVICKSTIAQSQQKLNILSLDDSLSWLPESYRTASAVFYIAEYVQNGRADSLKEALELLETELHRKRMEDSAFLGAYFANKSN